ncbi:hypothetical protein [Nocardiopsis sp. M1B1]|uniref:hypothetical protein n=1 Tax=Nocardiopsis sp. M1B1 TaxID=3450454 RepID=UPI0040394EC9
MASGSFGARVFRPGGRTRPRLPWSPAVLDAVYLLGALAVFALVGVIGRGVEKL